MGKFTKITDAITAGPLQPLAFAANNAISKAEYYFFDAVYAAKGNRKPDKDEVDFVKNNVTFMYKSFERQSMAKRLFKSIQSYYPGVRVVIADDSSSPLEIDDDCAEIIQLPFNSGLSVGLNRALARIKTPFLVKLDDDELLTRKTKVGDALKFLSEHAEIDIVGFCPLTTIKCKNPFKALEWEYNKFSMKEAPRRLLIPHMTKIDDTHIVMGKVPNCYLARTESIRKIGWDDNIRMIDHHEFFYRAAGILVAVAAKDAVIFHYHNRFDRKYKPYRKDIEGDVMYIRAKRRLEAEKLKKEAQLN